MVRREHLGVICVDVSELLKEHERRKVEKRDNMVLYNGSYLITDPMPSLPQGSTGRRSLSSSLSRGSSARTSLSKKDKTTGDGKRGGGGSGGKARRRGKGKKRKKKSGNRYDDSFTNSQHMMPLIPGVVSTPSEGHIICSGGYSSAVKASRRRPPPSPPPSGARNPASSVSAWYGANEQQRRTPIGDSDEGLQLSRKTSSRDGMQRRSPTPIGRIKPSFPRSPSSSSRRGGDEKEEESFTDVSEILDRGRRRLSRVMGALQKRIWDGQQASSEFPLGGGGGSDMDNNSLHQANTSTVEGNYTERLSPEMVGTLGVTSVPRSPDSWGAPCTQRPRLASRPKRSDAEFGVDTYIMHDTQGKERVMLLGVVSMLPRRLPQRVPSAKRRPTGTTLPPVFRRAARVVAAAQPTKRPKRF